MAKIEGLDNISARELGMLLQSGARFVQYKYCISIVIMTFRRGSSVYFIRPGESAVGKGMQYTLLTLLLGWWGIPFGPIFSIEALITNLSGGKDVTQEFLNALRSTARPPG